MRLFGMGLLIDDVRTKNTTILEFYVYGFICMKEQNLHF